MGTEDQLAWQHYPRPDETSPIRTWYSNFTRWTLFRVGKLRAHWLLETYTDVYQAAGRPEQFDMNDVQHRNLIHGITTDRHFSLKEMLIHTTHVTERFVTERCPPPFLAPPPYLFLSSFRSSEISCGKVWRSVTTLLSTSSHARCKKSPFNQCLCCVRSFYTQPFYLEQRSQVSLRI